MGRGLASYGAIVCLRTLFFQKKKKSFFPWLGRVRLALDWIFTYRGQIAMNGYQSWVGQDADMRI